MSAFRTAREGATATITIARPERRNALRTADVRELGELFAHVEPGVRVLVLTGAGTAFCAGADLTEIGAADAATRARQALDDHQDLTRAIVGCPAITIAAVNGPAVGLGAELALAADLRVIGSTASLAFAEVRRGLFETNGVTYLLPRLVGGARAADWLLSGRRIGADELVRAGLADRVTESDEFPPAVSSLAREIAQHAPISLGGLKQALRRTWQGDLGEMLDFEVEVSMRCLASSDVREGALAFAERRPPRFEGR